MALSRTIPLKLNRLLLDPKIDRLDVIASRVVGIMSPKDTRTQHVKKILGLVEGDSIRSGVLNGGIDNNGAVAWLACGSLQVSLNASVWPPSTRSSSAQQLPSASSGFLDSPMPRPPQCGRRPRVDVLLAVPSPRKLERVLPLLGSLGVDRIFLTGAAKVDARYLGSHLFLPRGQRLVRGLLREGLEQSGVSTWLPRVTVHKTLEWLLRDLDTLGLDNNYDSDCNGDVDAGDGDEHADTVSFEEHDAVDTFGCLGRIFPSPSSSPTSEATTSAPESGDRKGEVESGDGRARRGDKPLFFDSRLFRRLDGGNNSNNVETAPAAAGSTLQTSTLRVVAHPASAFPPRQRDADTLVELTFDTKGEVRRGANIGSSSGNDSRRSGLAASKSNEAPSPPPYIEKSMPKAAGNSYEYSNGVPHTLGTVPFPPAPSLPSLRGGGDTSAAVATSSQHQHHQHQQQPTPRRQRRRMQKGVHQKRLLVAVGPDGGWEVPRELDLLRHHGFEPVSLSKQRRDRGGGLARAVFGTLKTEVALAALLTRAHERLADEDEKYDREGHDNENEGIDGQW